MDYKQVIDGMKWVRTQEEIGAVARAEPPLRTAGLELPVFYAFQARAEWEVLGLAEEFGERLREEYGLHPAGQSGIGLDWVKLNQRIWVPADYLEARSILPDSRSIFSCDENNCFPSRFGRDTISDEDLTMKRKILYGSGNDPKNKYDGTSESKILALLTDSEWRNLARYYSQRLLHFAGSRYKQYVSGEFVPILENLIQEFQLEMK